MTDEYLALVGERIRERREERKWAQPELARRVGVSQSTVSRWENGWSDPGLLWIDLIAIALGMELEELLA